MVRKINDALAALRRVLEYLLISYQYDEAHGVMCFVFDYPEKDAGADRAFIRVRFEGVSNFQRIPGAFAELQRFTEAYSARATRAASVVQKIDIDAREGSIRIGLWFGHDFGGVSFVCGRVTADARNAYAIRTGADEWDYRDIDDGARMDFYDPFA
jgi:hypothetical protein